MTPLEMARKAITMLDEHEIPYSACVDFGGCDGWVDDYSETTVTLSRAQFLSELKAVIDKPELFEGLELDPSGVDYDEINAVCTERAFPEAGGCYELDDVYSLPESLFEIGETLSENADSYKGIMAFNAIETDTYTLNYEIVNGYGCEDTIDIELSPEQARGLIIGCLDELPEIQQNWTDPEEVCDFINDKINKAVMNECVNMADSNFDQQLEEYLDAWKRLIDSIYAGEIEEEDLEDSVNDVWW